VEEDDWRRPGRRGTQCRQPHDERRRHQQVSYLARVWNPARPVTAKLKVLD
jgi:hypothetical protein